MSGLPAGAGGGPLPRSPKVDGETRTVGLIGWPVTHSRGPSLHNAALAAAEIDAALEEDDARPPGGA